MVTKYHAIMTSRGAEKLAAAALTGETVGFSHMAVGDGGGAATVPDESQTGLVNEVYRAP